MAQPLLPDLLIEGYRGLRRLELKKLGHVNLIVGQNGVGKTSVLEAVRLYSSQAALFDLTDLLQLREEASDPGNWRNFEALFWNRSSNPGMRIGPRSGTLGIEIRETVQTRKDDGTIGYRFLVNGESSDMSVRIPTLRITQADKLVRYAPLVGGLRAQYIEIGEGPVNPSYSFVGAEGISYHQFGKLWDSIVLTDFEDVLNRAIAEVNRRIQRVSLIQNEGGTRLAMAKLKEADRRVPLRTLGDGINRFVGICLALANARNGYLLVDEFENGLHYKTQEALWKFVIRMARELNVQVFATTHSRDCIGAFGRATAGDSESEGVLIRLEEFRGNIVETHYHEDDIETITQNMIEVR